MKIYIGPYKNWIGPYQIAEKLLFWMDKDEDDRVHNFGTWLANKKDGSGSWLTKTCQWVDSKRKRKVKIRIDRYDTWGMDNTLAYIVLPMLKQLRDTKHGSPFVDQVDLPVELRSSKREQKAHTNGYWDKKLKATEEEIAAADEKFHAQWNWVLEQMIWSFEQELDEDDGHKHYYDPYESDEPTEKRTYSVLHDDGTTEEKDWFGDEESRRAIGKLNLEKMKAYEARKQLGFTLFGKYYQALWD